MTANAATVPAVARTVLAMSQPPRRSEQRHLRVPAPDRPVVPAGDLEVVVLDAGLRQLLAELAVLTVKWIVGARVEPEEDVCPTECVRHFGQSLERCVGCQALALVPEDRGNPRRLLVARPALDHMELGRVVEGDVDGAVAALRQAPERTAGGGRNRTIGRIDRVD